MTTLYAAFGDSNILCTATSPNTLPAYIGTALGVTIDNKGVGGNTTTQMAARFQSDIIANGYKHVIFLGGVNDISGGSITKAVFLSNYTAMLDACVANGIKAYVLLILPWKGGTNAQLTARDEWNADLKTLVVSKGFTWIDASYYVGQCRDNQVADNLWDQINAYDSGDHIHWTAAGYEQIAIPVARAMSGQLNYLRAAGVSMGTGDGSKTAFAISVPKGKVTSPVSPVIYVTGWYGRAAIPTATVTNLQKRSNDLTYWTSQNAGTGSAAVTATYNQTGPDGNATATRLQCDSGTGTTSGYYSQMKGASITGLTNGAYYTVSIMMKSNDSNSYTVYLGASGMSWKYSAATLNEGLVIDGTWRRFTFVCKATATSAYLLVGLYGPKTGSANRTADFLVASVQLEAGELATAPILTGASTATNSATVSVSGGDVTFAVAPAQDAAVSWTGWYFDWTVAGGSFLQNFLG